MKSVFLTQGRPQAIGVGGPTLAIVNDAWVDWTNMGTPGAGPVTGTILVGVGQPATTPAQAAFVVPPLTRAVLPIRDQGATVYLTYVSGPGASAGLASPFSNPTILPIEVWFDFSPEAVAGPAWAPAAYRYKMYGGAAGGGLVQPAWWDSLGDIWAPAPPEYVLAQAYPGGTTNPVLRPRLAPSNPVTVHAAVLANTLTALTGVTVGPAMHMGKVLKRLYVSSSAAGLFVVGDPGLTVGAPGNFEAARILVPAGDSRAIEFDEGLDTGFSGQNGGTWQFYFSVAATLDITAIMA